MKTFYTHIEITQALKDKKKGERLKKNILKAHLNYMEQFGVYELMDMIKSDTLEGIEKIGDDDDDYSIQLFGWLEKMLSESHHIQVDYNFDAKGRKIKD